MLYTEKTERKKGGGKAFLIFLASVVGVIILINVITAFGIEIPYRSIIDSVFFVFVIVLSYLLIRQYIYSYTFVADENFLTVYRCVGSRESALLRIKNIEMKKLVRGKEEVEKLLEENKDTAVNRCLQSEENENASALLFHDYNMKKDSVLIFEPSDKLFTIISEMLLDKE